MKSGSDTSGDDNSSIALSRRDFLEWATLSSAALAMTSSIAAAKSAIDTPNGRPSIPAYAKLNTLAPGAVSPEGWLQLHLRKQSEQLGTHLPEASSPFTSPYWAGEEPKNGGVSWWGWEQKGYWVDGALRCALVLRDKNLLQQALAPVNYTLNHVTRDGYLGPVYLKEPQVKNAAPYNYDLRWPHNVFFRALAAQGEATNDPRVAEAIRRHYLADRGRNLYGGVSLSITNVEGMLWAYQHTGDPQLLDMAKKSWDEWVTSFVPGDRESGDLHPTRVLSGTRIHAHGVVYAEKSKLPAILFLHTGDPEYLRYAIAAQERMFTHHMLIDGVASSSENFRGIEPLDVHETCNISAMTWGWGYLLMATGDALWADRIERACFNAGFGAIRKDWKGVQYFSCPNQVIATQDSSHVPYGEFELSGGWMAYRPNPGHHVACCGGSVYRFLPNYVIRMWMMDGNGGLAAVLYGPSSVRANVGANNESVEIHQETHYPFEEQIHFTIRAQRPVSFPLSLRIPRWCGSPQLSLNGEPLDLPKIEKGFVRIVRTFQPGDRITLALPMHTEVSFWPDDWSNPGLGVEHGPLVYSLKVDERWSPIVTPNWSTEQFPEWNAVATSEWNYGIAIEENRETQLPMRAKFERVAMTDDPWVDPPVKLTIPMKRIAGWDLRSDPAHPERKATPSLPRGDMLRAAKSAEVEQVSLVPYGSTHLRLTIFSQV